MLAGIVVLLYIALLILFVSITPWAPAAAVDFAFLSSYLVLCHRHGLDAIRGSERSHPFVGTLLCVVPLTVVLSTATLNGPDPEQIVWIALSAPFLLAISFWRRRRRARPSRWRAIEGAAILGAPVLFFALIARFLQQPAGIAMVFIIDWLEFSFGYVGSGSDRLIPATALSAAAAFLVARFVFKRSVVGSGFSALLLVYVIGGYQLFVVYYELPLDHTYEEVLAQPHATMLEVDPKRGPGRTLYIDQREERVYVAVKTTEMHLVPPPNFKSLSGVFSYDLASKRQLAFLALTAPCITMVVEEEQGVLYTCDVTSSRLFALDLETLRPKLEVSLPQPIGPEGMVKRDDRQLIARFENPGNGPDLLKVDSGSLNWFPIRLPERSLLVGNYALAIDEVHRKIFVPQIGNNFIVLSRLDWDGNFEKSVDLPGLTFEAVYSSVHQAVFVATLNRNVLYRVDARTMEVTEATIPNGIRSIRVGPGGLLVIGDYIRGRIYLYDPDAREIIHTLLVGRKNQAMSIASGSGRLFVYSDFGITIFDLPALLVELGRSARAPSE